MKIISPEWVIQRISPRQAHNKPRYGVSALKKQTKRVMKKRVTSTGNGVVVGSNPML